MESIFKPIMKDLFSPIIGSGSTPPFDPLTIPGTLDLWNWHDATRRFTDNTETTPADDVGDPLGAWVGQLDAYTLSTGTASTRLEIAADGILINATSTYKDLSAPYAAANTAPLTMLMRYVGTSGHNPRFAGYIVGGIATTGILSGATIFGRARSGTPLSSGVSMAGDHCVAVTFDGTSASIKIDGGAPQTIPVGSDATAVGTIKIASLLTGLGVGTVKYLQAIAGALTEDQITQWMTWARAQP